MSDERSLEALLSALDADPDDAVALAALADWFEEGAAAAAAEALRWAAARGRRPGLNEKALQYGRYYWSREEVSPLLKDARAQLPPALWESLKGNDEEPNRVGSFKSYGSPRAALLALAAAWAGGGAR